MKMLKSALILFFSIFATACANHTVSIMEENDAVKIGPGTDANYTQGLTITVASEDAYEPCDSGYTKDNSCVANSFGKQLINKLNVLQYDDTSEDNVYLVYGVAQQFYTPDDISIKEIIVEDRPYGGWLHGSLDIENIDLNDASASWVGDEKRTVRVRLGFVGPLSFAEDIQVWWHEICDCTTPEGWDNQIRNELGIMYGLRQENRLLSNSFSRNGSIKYDVISLLEANIGNVYTALEIGSQIRFGYNLPRSFGNHTISAISTGSEPIQSNFYTYMFAGVQGRVVLRDIFLDGNTITDSPHTVDKETYVGDFKVGGVIGYKNIELQALFVHRTRQFETQENKHKFGQITIRYKF